jgi:hypothetical protein
MPLPTTIEEVIVQLGDIIATETAAGSNLAFFPVLYKKVTERIQLGIQNKEFKDNPRMERLDVIFASRYIEAYRQFTAGEKPTQSWEIAFQAAVQKKFIIMQHLLLGINAHINLDLGIAVAQTVGETGDLAGIESDFNKINAILAAMVAGVEASIGRVSPIFYLLEKVGKGKEDKIVTFSINLARDGAWMFANQYHISGNKSVEISQRDAIIAKLATKLTTTRSRLLRWTIRAIRFFETKNVAKVVAILSK